MTTEEENNISFELAKAKTEPKSLKIEAEGESPVREDEEGQLTIDVYRDKNDIVIQSTVAGVDPENLEVHITPESVTIRGKREKTQTIEDKDYYYQECFWGTFSRSIILPQEVDPDKSTASIKNGILTIRMPELDRRKGRKLKVKMD